MNFSPSWRGSILQLQGLPGQVHQKSGAVYVAMGTVVRPPKSEIRGIAANLVALNRFVLWKISDAELPGQPHILLFG